MIFYQKKRLISWATIMFILFIFVNSRVIYQIQKNESNVMWKTTIPVFEIFFGLMAFIFRHYGIVCNAYIWLHTAYIQVNMRMNICKKKKNHISICQGPNNIDVRLEVGLSIEISQSDIYWDHFYNFFPIDQTHTWKILRVVLGRKSVKKENLRVN